MELRHLRYFVAVAEVLNFTKAATRLRLAQPALSHQVAELKEELGVDLLRRTAHGMRLPAPKPSTRAPFVSEAPSLYPASHDHNVVPYPLMRYRVLSMRPMSPTSLVQLPHVPISYTA